MVATQDKSEPISHEIIDHTAPWLSETENIVFHHGLGACGAIWSGWIPALVDSYRLVRFDMRGHGDTPLPAGFQWSMQSMIDDLSAVIDMATHDGTEAQRVHLVGESIGGTVVLAFAAAHPQRVATVTVCNGAHAGGSIENLNAWAEVIDGGGMSAWSALMMENRFYEGGLGHAMRQWYERQQAACEPAAILDAVSVLTQTDLTPQLARILVPVLLLHPDDSPFIPVEIMADLNRQLPNSRLEVFPGTRHGLPFSHAQGCASSLRAFLSTHG